jgi:hypothetical protein
MVITLDGATAFVSAAIGKARSCKLDSTHFAIIYTASSKTYVMVASVSGTEITYGTPLQIVSSAVTNLDIASTDSTHFAVVYHSGSSIVTKYFSVSETTPTLLDTDTIYGTGSGGSLPSICALSSSLFVIAFNNIQTGYCNVVACSISGSAVTVGSLYALSCPAPGGTTICAMDSTHFVVAWYESASSYDIYVCGGSVSGTSITLGTESNGFDNFNLGSPVILPKALVALSSSLFVLVMGAARVKIGAGTLSGVNVSVAEANVVDANGTSGGSYASVSRKSDTEGIIAFKDTDDSYKGHLVTFSVSGTTTTINADETTFESGSSSHNSIDTLDTNVFVITFQDGGDSDYGKAIIGYFAATTSIKTVDGLARASVKTINGLAIASVKTFNNLA